MGSRELISTTHLEALSLYCPCRSFTRTVCGPLLGPLSTQLDALGLRVHSACNANKLFYVAIR
jgi:hypothetical protein